jgi:hypothetical protein
MMAELIAPDINFRPPKNADEATPAPQETDDYCVLQVSVSDNPLGWLAWSTDSYLEIVQQRVDATAFRFGTGGPDYILPPRGNASQRGLGISTYQTAQFYLDSSWWTKWMLKGQYLLCMYNLQYLGIQKPDDPYNSYLFAWNPYQALQITRQSS